MALLEIGRICIKRAGKNSGEKVIIVGFEKNLPIVEGLHSKRKKCNPKHLFPTVKKAELKENPPREEVIKFLKEGR